MEKDSTGQNFDQILSEIYLNPSLQGSFSGVASLYDAAKLVDSRIKLRNVKDFLKRQSTYVDFRDIRKTFPRRMYIAGFVDSIWGLDLTFIQKYKKYNNGYQYILTVVDFFSRYLYAKPLKTKMAHETTSALEACFAENGSSPFKIHW